MYQYFLKVVGTQYHFIDGQAVRRNVGLEAKHHVT